MRKIDFRFWHIKDKVMCPVSEMFYSASGLRISGPGVYPNMLAGTDCILMQYTGLHDKNGKEIYEGDIVKIIDSSGDYGIGKVKWLESENGLRWIIEGDFEYFMPYGYVNLTILTNCEIIGNIYEDERLLK